MDKKNKKIIPTVDPIEKKAIPKELKKLKKWGLWQWAFKKGQWTKVPCLYSGVPINFQDFNLTFKEAIKAIKFADFNAGLGFTFKGCPEVVGVDFDDCVKDGVIKKKILKKIKKLDSYWEFSPSGNGVHVMGLGGEKLGPVDGKMIYNGNRFFTFTGKGEGKIRDISKPVMKLFGMVSDFDHIGGGKKAGVISQIDLMKIVVDIKPNLPEPEWFQVCKVIHACSPDPEAGFDLFVEWSQGLHCGKKHRYKREGGFSLKACEEKWKRCKSKEELSMAVGLPTLRKIQKKYTISGIIYTKKTFKTPEDEVLNKDGVKLVEYVAEGLTHKHLPKNLRGAALECQRFNKVAIDPVVSSILLILSAAINKKVSIIERGMKNNCSLGLLIALPTGGRKSAIDNVLMYPYRKFAEAKIKQYHHEKTANEVQVKLLTKKFKELEKDEDIPEELKAEEMTLIQREINKYSRPCPSYIVADVTEERLSDMLAANDEVLFMQSDDARNPIKNLNGRYDNGGMDNIYIACLTGGSYNRERVGHGGKATSVNLINPCMNVSFKVQYDMVGPLISNGAMRESGLIARMFIKSCSFDISKQFEEQPGELDLQIKEMEPYNKAIEELLNYEGPTIKSYLSEEAKEERRLIANWYASKVKKGGSWSDFADITNKFVTACVKMATIVALGSDPGKLKRIHESDLMVKSFEVTKKEFKVASSIIKIFTEQTIEVLSNFETNTIKLGAEKLLTRLKAKKAKWEEMAEEYEIDSWSERELRAMYNAANRSEGERYIACLVEEGFLVVREDGRYYPRF